DSQAVVVLADEWVVPHEVDVVLDDHDVALGPLRIHAAAGVADNENLAAQRLHHTDGEGDLLEGVAFVSVKAAFHRDDRLSGQFPADEAAGVGNHGRLREMWYFLVAKDRLAADLLGESPEAGAENDADTRLALPAALDGLFRFLDLVVEVEHLW